MGFKGVRVVSFSTFLSRIFGFFRDSLIAYTFGATLYTDAFYVAFRIPNLFRRLLGEGALTSAFIPVFKRIHIREDRNYEAKFLKGYFFILLVVVSLIVASYNFCKIYSDGICSWFSKISISFFSYSKAK